MFSLNPDDLQVESFSTKTTRTPSEPATYQTDAEHLSICLVSCAGSCGQNCLNPAV